MPVAAVAGQVVDPVQVDAGEPAIAVAAQAAGGCLQAILRGVATAAQAGLQHGFGPIGLVAQDDVDHAGHGVSAVDRRGTATDQLDAFDEAERNAAQVGEPSLLQRYHRVARQAPAIDQEQSGARSHAVEAGGGCGTDRQVLRVTAARTAHRRQAIHAGQVPQQVEQAAVAAAQDVGAIDRGNRQRGLHRGAWQAAAGDVDWCQFHLRRRPGGIVVGSHHGLGRGCCGNRGRTDAAHHEATRRRAQDRHRHAGNQLFQGAGGIGPAVRAVAVQSCQLTGVEQQRDAALPGPLLQRRRQWAGIDAVGMRGRRFAGSGGGQCSGQQRQAQQGAEQPPLQRTRSCHHCRPPQ